MPVPLGHQSHPPQTQRLKWAQTQEVFTSTVYPAVPVVWIRLHRPPLLWVHSRGRNLCVCVCLYIQWHWHLEGCDWEKLSPRCEPKWCSVTGLQSQGYHNKHHVWIWHVLQVDDRFCNSSIRSSAICSRHSGDELDQVLGEDAGQSWCT